MAGRGKRDRGKEHFWRSMLRQWRRSGQTVRAFCAEHGLAQPSFYAWRRVLAARDQEPAPEAAPGRVQPQRRRQATDDPPVFVPVRVIEAAAPAALEVVLRCGRVVRVPPGCDSDTLRQLLAILEEGRPC